MNIAFLTTEYVTEQEFDGGLSNYLYRVTKSLMSNGHYVEIFTLSDKDGEIFYDGVKIHQVKNKSKFFNFLNRLTRYKFKRTFRFLSLSYCLNRRLQKRQKIKHFDIIQASSCFACGLFSTLFNHPPIVIRVSSFEPLFRKFYQRQLNLDQWLCEWLELYAIRRSNAVYTPSKLLANILKNEKQIQTDVLRPPFLIETDHFDESLYKTHLNGKKYLLFFGSIGFLKGCETIAQSLPKLLPKYPDMYFVFVGKVLEGPLGMTMIQYIYHKADRQGDQVKYLGVLTHPQLYPIIKSSYAVVLPSLVDNFPNTMLEAMAFGKIVIGTKGTSFEEFIDNDISGILVQPNNVSELTKAIEKVWNMSDEKRKLIGHEAKKKVSTLSPRKMCKELEEYFQKVLEKER